MKRGNRPITGLLRCFVACWLLWGGGCAHRNCPPDYSRQEPPPFSQAGEAFVPDRWWMTFSDPGLDQQINLALGSSFTLNVARQRLRAARAIARREASNLFPDVNGVADVDYMFAPGEDAQRYVFGFTASYPVDLWGQIESRVEAEGLRAAAVLENVRGIALTLSAEIANAWLSLIEAKAQLELINEQIDTNETGLLLQEARFERGLILSADVLRQRQLVEATLEQKAIAKSNIETIEHRLAVLTGEMPQLATYEPGLVLPELPPIPITGLPSDLLRRRPDTRRDFVAFRAADRDLAAAIADQYPRLNLTGSLLSVADRPETIFRDWFVSMGASLVAPLIDGGQRRAEVDRTSAVAYALFQQYGQTMLIAFQQVEDALARERYQRERLTHLQAQLDLADESTERLREQYLLEPNTDYLAVLTADTGKQRLQREVLSAQLELRLIRVSLYLALAGGFDPVPQAIPEFVVSQTEEPDVTVNVDSTDTSDVDGQSEPDAQAANVETIATPASDEELQLNDFLKQLDTSEESTSERLRELLRGMIDE